MTRKNINAINEAKDLEKMKKAIMKSLNLLKLDVNELEDCLKREDYKSANELAKGCSTGFGYINQALERDML